MQLVTINNGEVRTTTLAIAEGTGNQHKAVIQLVRTYQADLEQFGLVTFEMAARLEGQHGAVIPSLPVSTNVKPPWLCPT